MTVNLDDIKNFITVAKTLNITRASELLGMSQPTLSYSVKRLEGELGQELIIRLKNGVQLTKVGEEFCRRSNKLILYWQDAQKIFSLDQESLSGEFSIAIHPSVAIYTLGTFLPEIASNYPDVNFKLIHGLSREMTEKIINWEVDFSIAINPIEHPDLIIRELGVDEVTLFKSTSNNFTEPSKKLIFDPELSQSQYVLKKLRKLNLNISGYIHSSNLEVIAKLTSSGAGVGLLPSRVAQGYKDLKKIKGAPVFKDKICLIYRKEKHINPMSRIIIDMIRNTSI